VEANIARVLSRLFDLQTPIDTGGGREQLWSTAAQLLPNRNAAQHNSALMELGALVCTGQPKCSSCPVQTFCRASEPKSLPRKNDGSRSVNWIRFRFLHPTAARSLLSWQPPNSTLDVGRWTLDVFPCD